MEDLVMTAFDWTIDTLMIGLSLCDIGVTLGRSFSSQPSYQLFNPSESIARRWLICVPLGISLMRTYGQMVASIYPGIYKTQYQ